MNTKNVNKLWSKYYIITILFSIGINIVSHLLLSTIVIHANAMYYAALDSGLGIGSLSWGLVAEVLGGYSLIFSIASAIAIIGMIVYVLSERKLSKAVVTYSV